MKSYIKLKSLYISSFLFIQKTQKVGIRDNRSLYNSEYKNNYSAEIQSFWFLKNQGKPDSCLSWTTSTYYSSRSTLNRCFPFKDKKLGSIFFFLSSKISACQENKHWKSDTWLCSTIHYPDEPFCKYMII